MNFHFSQLTLPPLNQFRCEALIKLAGNNSENSFPQPLQIPSCVPQSLITPPRKIDEIISDIQNSQIDRITLLEWVYCLYLKQKWDLQNPEQAENTSEAIWKVANHNAWLKHRLFWDLVIHYNQDNQTLASSLINSFSIFIAQTNSEKVSVQIINILSKPFPASELAKLSWQNLLTPRQLLTNYQLPHKINAVKEAFDYVAIQFTKAKNLNSQQVKWLLNCLKQMSREQELKTIDYLLINTSPEITHSHSELASWISQNYGSDVINSRWSELSSTAKTALKKWIGAVNYRDFQKLVDVILKKLYLQEYEAKRLRNRKEFWANYSDRFERIRILLPQSSVKVLENSFADQDISILIEDGSSPTEVCIFDFGEWFIVEFFRGNGSETRLFKNDSIVEKKLFHSHELSVKRLRCLGGEIHDHVFIWQYYCEQWLRRKNIFPNQGITRFLGLSFLYNQYSLQQGLPEPSWENKQQRSYRLEQWQREINRLEQEAKRFCQDNQIFQSV
ncbi:hypothetical protein STA3757_11910 [Stanieria sp. NIES-3757]|nr:hypothetical protein STA3757_11910 [Stanieria sp. NIES-3757]